MCPWARAILQHNLTGPDVPPNSINSYEGSPPEQMIHHHEYVTIYSDGAGYAPRSNRAGQVVGSGGFITASHSAAWGELQAHFLTHVPGEQTVPRAEIHAATHALQMFSNAAYVLVVTDAEEFFLSATCPTRLHNALAGPNADLWQVWQDAVGKCQGGLTISHVRAHALDDDSAESMKRLQQNKHRRRYRPPAGRPDFASNKDRYAQIRYHDAHEYLWHSLGNTFADAAARAAQRAALPSAWLIAEFDRFRSFAFLVARRNAIIEAHCRDTNHRPAASSTHRRAPNTQSSRYSMPRQRRHHT